MPSSKNKVLRSDVGFISDVVERDTAENLNSTVLGKNVFGFEIDSKGLRLGDGDTLGGTKIAGGGAGIKTITIASTGEVALSSSPTGYDGASVGLGDTILLKDQSNSYNNGIYAIGLEGQPLVRDANYALSSDFEDNLLFLINEGSDADKLFKTSVSGLALDSAGSLTFTQFDSQSAKYEVTEEEIFETDSSLVQLRLAADNKTLWLDVPGQSGKFLINAPVVQLTSQVPGAHPDQLLYPHVSSPDGAVLHLYEDTEAETWRAFLVAGNGSGSYELSKGLSISIDETESFDLEYKDIDNKIGLGATEEYSLIDFSSDSKGSNGLSLVQNGKFTAVGANPAPLVLHGGGEEPEGRHIKLNNAYYDIVNYVGDREEFRKIARKGMICQYTGDNSVYMATSTSSELYGAVQTGTAATPVVVTSSGHNLVNDDFVQVNGMAGVSGAFKVGGVTTDTYELVGSSSATPSPTGSWYKLAHLTQISSGNNFGTL